MNENMNKKRLEPTGQSTGSGAESEESVLWQEHVFGTNAQLPSLHLRHTVVYEHGEHIVQVGDTRLDGEHAITKVLLTSGQHLSTPVTETHSSLVL
jgi:hypothetical protein